MDLEEQEGVEPVQTRCANCGAKLTDEEIQAALEGASETFLCSRCAVEVVPESGEIESD
jgi:recombinational DNA repair protein (RecF pathway)